MDICDSLSLGNSMAYPEVGSGDRNKNKHSCQSQLTAHTHTHTNESLRTRILFWQSVWDTHTDSYSICLDYAQHSYFSPGPGRFSGQRLFHSVRKAHITLQNVYPVERARDPTQLHSTQEEKLLEKCRDQTHTTVEWKQSGLAVSDSRHHRARH